MGNYQDLELNFIERTIELISQYNNIVDQYPIEKQFNHTLTINCLLGLIVLPKERVITYIPNDILNSVTRKKIGLETSKIGEGIRTLRELIQRLRHSVAHFDIAVISKDENFFIDLIEFKDTQNGDVLIAKIKSNELLPFLRCYSNILIENLKRYRNHMA